MPVGGVGGVLDSLTSAELTEWQAFDQVSPFGPERADLRTGLVTQAIFAAAGVDTELRNCMPDYERREEDPGQSIEGQIAMIQMISEPFLKKEPEARSQEPGEETPPNPTAP